jgi:diaminohydroxyphosphoribosylaminopyrimidine deaminase/5-amino-6-(5-phosphoribosylamino)uracil reductase
MTDFDEKCMRLTLELAERGRGHVEPNPLVGAVLARDGRVVGSGWHRRFGEAHAEVNALAEAGDAARDATLYVTLEPCCHHGKTPPCTDAVLRAGVNRVVVAMNDPFPEVSGQGLKTLRDAGVGVEVGLFQAEAVRLNAPYLKLLRVGRPYVHAKWAMTLDGKTATPTGDSKWISNEASRARGHALRGRMDAVIVGIGTVLADDPLLTARPPGPRRPTRVVIDSRGRMPSDSQLARTLSEGPVLVSTSARADDRATARLRSLGVEVFCHGQDDRVSAVAALLEELGRRRMTNVLVEGGSGVLGSFLDAREVDEVHVFVSPRLAGGGMAKTPVGGRGVERIGHAIPLAGWQIETLDGDVYLRGWRA